MRRRAKAGSPAAAASSPQKVRRAAQPSDADNADDDARNLVDLSDEAYQKTVDAQFERLSRRAATIEMTSSEEERLKARREAQAATLSESNAAGIAAQPGDLADVVNMKIKEKSGAADGAGTLASHGLSLALDESSTSEERRPRSFAGGVLDADAGPTDTRILDDLADDDALASNNKVEEAPSGSLLPEPEKEGTSKVDLGSTFGALHSEFGM